jgi:hypothetical protein
MPVPRQQTSGRLSATPRASVLAAVLSSFAAGVQLTDALAWGGTVTFVAAGGLMVAAMIFTIRALNDGNGALFHG